MVLIILMAPINQIKKHKKSAVITVLWERQSAAQLRIKHYNPPITPLLRCCGRQGRKRKTRLKGACTKSNLRRGLRIFRQDR